jgi:large subunit ribosomal protein L21
MEQTNNFPKYAIFQIGGHQYQGIEGKTIAIQKIDGDQGQKIEFSEVLLRKTSEDNIEIGQPFLQGALKASIVKQTKGPKLTVFRHKRRTKYRVKRGHRQPMTVIRVESIA